MKISKTVFFVLGLILLTINIIGLTKSLRNPELYTEQKTGRLNDVSIRLEDAEKAILKKQGESDRDFAIRINEVVSKSMSHYWHKEGLEKYHLRVPVWENYILYCASLFKDDKRYEFIDYRKDLERGVGLCSTHSIVVKGILRDNGINAELWDIAGHVLVRAQTGPDQWYILDPDFGLYIPYDIDDIEKDPELVRPTYENMASLYKPDYNDPYTTDHVVELYAKPGNHIYTYDPALENTSYIAIWLIPLILILPFSISLTKKYR